MSEFKTFDQCRYPIPAATTDIAHAAERVLIEAERYVAKLSKLPEEAVVQQLRIGNEETLTCFRRVVEGICARLVEQTPTGGARDIAACCLGVVAALEGRFEYDERAIG